MRYQKPSTGLVVGLGRISELSDLSLDELRKEFQGLEIPPEAWLLLYDLWRRPGSPRPSGTC